MAQCGGRGLGLLLCGIVLMVLLAGADKTTTLLVNAEEVEAAAAVEPAHGYYPGRKPWRGGGGGGHGYYKPPYGHGGGGGGGKPPLFDFPTYQEAQKSTLIQQRPYTAALLRALLPDGATDALFTTYITPEYFSVFEALGQGDELVAGANALNRAWNDSAGISQLILSGKTYAPVKLPSYFLTPGDDLNTLAELVVLYYSAWLGVDQVRRQYLTQVNDYQRDLIFANQSSVIAPDGPWAPQTVNPQQPYTSPYLNRWVGAASASIGNAVTAYTSVNLDFSNGPLLFEAPAPIPSNIYFLISFYNTWGEVFTSFGTRTGLKTPAKFIFLPPKLTPEWKRAIRPYTSDPNVITVTFPGLDAYIISRITGPVNFALNWTITRLPGVQPIAYEYYWGTDPQVFNIWSNVDPLYFWRIFGLTLTRNTRPGLSWAQQRLLQRLGFSSSKGFQPELLNERQLQALAAAIPIANQGIASKYWLIGSKAQNYWHHTGTWNSVPGVYFSNQAGFFKGFWIANRVEDAAYILQFVDSEARRLDGNYNYTITFAANNLPPTNGAFWSVQVTRLDQVNLANLVTAWTIYKTPEMYGYVLGKVIASIPPEKLAVKPNGDVQLLLTATPRPAGFSGDFNWLELPARVPFYALLRIYNGYPSAVDGTYTPPPVIRA